MQKEPTLEQLEKLISAFRQNGGTDAELTMVAQEIIRDFSLDSPKPLEVIFQKEDHPTIAQIKEFKKDPKPIRHKIKNIWSKSYVKYPTIFITSFVLLFAIINFPLIIARIMPPKIEYKTVKEVVRPTTEKSAQLDPGEVVPASPTLVVPKISVTAPIQFVDTNNEKTVHDALSNGLVHYFGTASPGEVGNTFITGHSSNYWWDKGAFNYVFVNLDKLEVGDQTKIYYNGNKYLYEVKSKTVVEPTDLSVLNPTDTPTLTLMTCTPPGTSWKRLIVKFDQVAPKYQAPRVVEKQQPVEVRNLTGDSGNIFDWIAKLFNF